MNTLLRFAAIVSLSSAACALVGCSGAAESSQETSGADLSADASKGISGTFLQVGDNVLDLAYTSYTFKTDGTFSAVGQCQPDAGAFSTCHAITVAKGTYTIKTVKVEQASDKEITLVDSLGNTSTYLYSYANNTMTFAKTVTGETEFFYNPAWTKKIPDLGVCQDNAGNSLGECEGSDSFSCGLLGESNVYACTPSEL